jgi:hypothetical protein
MEGDYIIGKKGVTTIEYKPTEEKGYLYLIEHWNNEYVLAIFRNAKGSTRAGEFKVNNLDKGMYVLKRLGAPEEHHYRLEWRHTG